MFCIMSEQRSKKVLLLPCVVAIGGKPAVVGKPKSGAAVVVSPRSPVTGNVGTFVVGIFTKAAVVGKANAWVVTGGGRPGSVTGCVSSKKEGAVVCTSGGRDNSVVTGGNSKSGAVVCTSKRGNSSVAVVTSLKSGKPCVVWGKRKLSSISVVATGPKLTGCVVGTSKSRKSAVVG